MVTHMCKRINIFFLCFAAFYFVSSIAISFIMGITGIQLPYWMNILLSQSIILLPAVIFVLVMKIDVFKALPFKKIKVGDAFLSILLGYLLVPLVLFINNISMMFSTNHLEASANELMPFKKIKVGDAFLSILLGYLLVPLVLFINNISMMFSTNHLEASANELTSYPFLIQIVLLAVIPAMVEEFIFRGLFYHSYRKNGILGAALASAFAFGLIHFNLNQFCYAFVLGIVFALIVEATGSIFSSMLAHFAINTYSIIMMKLLSNLNQFCYAFVLGIVFALIVEATGSIFSSMLAHFAINTYSIIMMKLLSVFMDITGMSPQTVQEMNGAAASMENSAQMEVIAQASYIFAVAVIGVLAVGFFVLAMLVLRTLAKRNGRLEYLRLNLKKGTKAQNNEKFVTIPYILTAVFIVVYMILNEVLIRIM